MAIISAQIKTTNTDILDPTGAGSPAGAVPTGKTYAITNILICNNSTTTDATVDMHLVKSGSPLSNSVTRVLHDLTLPAKETLKLLSGPEGGIVGLGAGVHLLHLLLHFDLHFGLHLG